MRYGMTIPLQQVPLLEQRTWIEGVRRAGFDDLWSSEAMHMDGFVPLALASQWVDDMRLGCACFPVQTRGPALLAQSAMTLSHAAPGRCVLGVGASSQPIVEFFNGIPFEKPYAAVRDTVRFLEKAFAGEVVDEEFETFQVQRFRLGAPPAGKLPVLVAGLREGMIRLGAREADGVILNMCTPEDVKKIVPLVRQFGPDKEIALRLTMCPTRDYDSAMSIAKRWAMQYVTVESYRSQQQWLGRGELIAEANERWSQGDRKGALASLPDEAVQAGWCVGSPEQVRARCREYEEAGLDTLILSYLEDITDNEQVLLDVSPHEIRSATSQEEA